MSDSIVIRVNIDDELDDAMDQAGYKRGDVMTSPIAVWFDTSSDRSVAIELDVQENQL